MQFRSLGTQMKPAQYFEDRPCNLLILIIVSSITNVAEPPNLMPPRGTCPPLDTKYSREDTKLRSSVEHTPRENSKIHIFSSGS